MRVGRQFFRHAFFYYVIPDKNKTMLANGLIPDV